MRPKSSLMPPFNSLLRRNKFPVPMRRELSRKGLILLLFWRFRSTRGAPNRRKFPVNSLLTGNSERETSSFLTLSSSGESCKPPVPQRRSKDRREAVADRNRLRRRRDGRLDPLPHHGPLRLSRSIKPFFGAAAQGDCGSGPRMHSGARRQSVRSSLGHCS